MKKVTAVFIAAIIMLSACSSATLDSTGKEVVDAVKSVTDSENKYVLMVKDGYRENDPDLTYNKAFATFFGTPRWSYFESDEGQDVVEFTGDCTYQEAPVKARIQFVVDEENGTFEAAYLAFNEVPQDALTLTALITTAFDEAEKKLELTSSESDINTTANVPVSGDEAVLAFKHWEVEHPIGWPYNVTAINDNDPDSFNLDFWIDAEQYGTVSVKKSDGTMTVIAMGSSNTPLDINEWYETYWRSEYEKSVNSYGAAAAEGYEESNDTFDNDKTAFDATWADMMRYPEQYIGYTVSVSGIVTQVLNDGYFSVNSNGDDSQRFLIDAREPALWNSDMVNIRVLEGDRVLIYGTFEGLQTVEYAINNVEHQVPYITATEGYLEDAVE